MIENCFPFLRRCFGCLSMTNCPETDLKHLMKSYNYFVYITTNSTKDVFYIGVTNSLEQGLVEHHLNKDYAFSFAGKYYCDNLIYYERFTQIKIAIKREKQIKGWTRAKKEYLIKLSNPQISFLNKDIMRWPPDAECKSR
jgi:putative endonuclease